MYYSLPIEQNTQRKLLNALCVQFSEFNTQYQIALKPISYNKKKVNTYVNILTPGLYERIELFQRKALYKYLLL